MQDHLTKQTEQVFNTLFALTANALTTTEKLATLNMKVARASMAETQKLATQILAAKTPQEVQELHAEALRPSAEKAAQYAEALGAIVSESQKNATKAVETHADAVTQFFPMMLDAVANQAPAGSEGAVSLFKSVLNAQLAAADSTKQAVKQVTETMEAGLEAASTSIKATAQSGKKK